MNYEKNAKLIHRAKSLRKNMTPEERKLWYQFLRHHPVHFRKQEVIGNYIVDFCAISKKFIIELDGSQHYEEESLKKDKRRTEHLQDLGFTVHCFTNYDIRKHFEETCTFINRLLDENQPKSAYHF